MSLKRNHESRVAVWAEVDMLTTSISSVRLHFDNLYQVVLFSLIASDVRFGCSKGILSVRRSVSTSVGVGVRFEILRPGPT